MWIVGGVQLLLQVFLLLQQLQIGSMGTLLVRYAMSFSSNSEVWIRIWWDPLCVCYEHNTSLFFHVFQMRLGSAFGAFLDPVADKVSTFFFAIVCVFACWFALVKFIKVLWLGRALDRLSCLLNAAHGCCHLSLVVYTTLGSSYVWTSAMAIACTCNCNNW